MENLKQSKKLIFKLFILFCFNIYAIQPDFLAQSVATALYSIIVGFFL